MGLDILEKSNNYTYVTPNIEGIVYQTKSFHLKKL